MVDEPRFTEETTEDEVVSPEREIEINGETITVSPLSLKDQLRMTPKIRPIINDIRELVGQAENPGDVSEQDILDVLASHADRWIEFTAVSAAVSQTYIESLDYDSFIALGYTAWGVNAGFFTSTLRLSEALQPSEETESDSE